MVAIPGSKYSELLHQQIALEAQIEKLKEKIQELQEQMDALVEKEVEA